ncbi:MAG: FAD-dependent oxidoreductase, partial [Burkholderiaceae bacterium]
MQTRHDLVVIGTGTAAMTAAMRVRAAGWSVGVVDFRPFGGTCALRGCDPKKMLIGAAAAIDHARRMKGKGVNGELHINWPELMAFKRGFTDPVPAKHEQLYMDKGIATYHGAARFTGRNTIEVNGELLEAKYVLIAAGAEPVKLGIPGDEHLITNEEFLALPQLPRRIVLVGGGYIAAEFSHIAARAGAQVTILQQGERMLKGFDPDVVGWLMGAFEAIGIDVRLQATVGSIEKGDSDYQVHALQRGQPVLLQADLVVHAAGRAPA